MKELISQIIEKARSLGATYADSRYDETKSTRIVVKNQDVITFQTTFEVGMGLRLLIDGAWGFITSNNPKELLDKMNNAQSIAQIAASTRKEKIEVQEQEKVVDDVVWKPKIAHEDKSIEEKMDFVLKANKKGMELSPAIKQIQTTYLEGDGERIVATTEGTLVRWKRSATICAYRFIAKENDVMVERSFSVGGTGGLEAVPYDHVMKEINKEGKTVLELLKAPAAPAGDFPAVLNYDLGYTLAHEAFGHLCEGDSVLRGDSVLEGKIGDKIASSCVTILDDPTMVEDNGRPAYGSFPYDDEGIRGVPTVLLEDGIFKSYMHSRETAKKTGQKLTGNARVESYRFLPQVRMTNTFFKPGDFSKEELFEGIKDGIYLVDAKGGQTTGQGTFHVGVSYVYKIKNGELDQICRGTGVGGRTLDTLTQINAVGNTIEYDIGGCGKGDPPQSVRTGSNGPMVRLDKITIGG